VNGLPLRQDVEAYAQARKRLVRRLAAERTIKSRRIEDAFLAVPRESFVPPDSPAGVYADTTIPLEGSQGSWLTTSSQPTMMAIMLEQLQVEPGSHVLEIGAGTGYNAALLAKIAGADGVVHSVEYESEAAERSARALAAAGSSAIVHRADGADGWPPDAPYDRIIATVAVWDIPPAWTEQATEDARIVAPINILGCDYSVALKRDGEDWISDSMEPCAFVRFKGRLAVEEHRLTVGGVDAPILALNSESPHLPDVPAVSRWIESGQGEPVRGVSTRDGWEGFALHLLFKFSGNGVLRGVSYGRGIGWQGQAVGLWDEDGLALVTSAGTLEHFGDGDTVDLMRTELAEWRNAGAPGLGDVRLRFRPGDVGGQDWLTKASHALHLERVAAPNGAV